MRLGVEAALVRGVLVPGDVEVDEGVVIDVGLAGGARGRIAVPGFVDLQVNGFGGVDFLAAGGEDYARAGEALLQTGVTAYQPTFITAAESAMIDALRAMPPNGSAPHVVGAHLEGPFLSPERLGTHPFEHRRDPDLDLLDRLLDVGRVTEMTLAPELTGAGELIRRLLDRGVVVSAGHTNATAEQARAAFDVGVSTVTHLFNAMRPFRSRDPGIIGVALTRPEVFVQLIVDGHHLADETVLLVWAAAAGRLALVSDATAGAGVGGGQLSARRRRDRGRRRCPDARGRRARRNGADHDRRRAQPPRARCLVRRCRRCGHGGAGAHRGTVGSRHARARRRRRRRRARRSPGHRQRALCR